MHPPATAIPQVQVELAGPATITAVTTIEGSYTIDGVPPGNLQGDLPIAALPGGCRRGLGGRLPAEMIDGSTVMSSTSEKTVVDVVAEIAPAVATAEAMLVERRLSSTVSDTIGAEESQGRHVVRRRRGIGKGDRRHHHERLRLRARTRPALQRHHAEQRDAGDDRAGTPRRPARPVSRQPDQQHQGAQNLFPRPAGRSFRPAWCRSRPPSFLPSRPSASATRSASTTKRRAAHGSTTPAAAGTFSASTTARARCPPRSPPIRAWTASTFPAASCKSSADSSRRTGSARRAT